MTKNKSDRTLPQNTALFDEPLRQREAFALRPKAYHSFELLIDLSQLSGVVDKLLITNRVFRTALLYTFHKVYFHFLTDLCLDALVLANDLTQVEQQLLPALSQQATILLFSRFLHQFGYISVCLLQCRNFVLFDQFFHLILEALVLILIKVPLSEYLIEIAEELLPIQIK